MKAQITTLALCAMTLAACNHDKDDAPQPSNSGEIVIDANVGQMTEKKSLKLGTTFDAGDAISVYAWTGSSSAIDAENLQVNNAINTLGDDGKWTATPKMLWKDGQSKHYFLGVYPQKTITNFTADEYALNTADQEASDVLVATNLDGISYRSTSVPLTFKHIMSVLYVNINYANFSTEPTEAIVKVNAKTNATINYLTKSVTPTGDNSDIVLPAIETVDGYKFSYKSVLIPQSGIKEIVIRIGDQSFAYVPQKGITLKSGCYTTINMTIRRNEITNDNVSIVDWNKEEPIDVDALEKGDPSTVAAVDLGLTSGTLWADRNIGASAPEEYGDYYAWGEIETKDYCDWSTYKYCNGSNTTMNKYCTNSSYGTVDNKTELDDADDVAVQTWGGKWKMPTTEQQQELISECYWVWTNTYNAKSVNGYIVYKAKNASDKGQYSGYTPSDEYDVTSDAHIFLPTAGYGGISDVIFVSTYGVYWSRSLYTSSAYGAYGSDDAYVLDFTSSHVFRNNHSNRNYGRSVRAVCPAE
ncbi:MAG: fimbrillin family protein [Bacteroidales bacterium]|nr:fimbrillin family protein [Bacteroidales bacterium]